MEQIVYKPGGAWARFWATVIDSVALGVPAFLFITVISLISGDFDYSSWEKSGVYKWSTFLFLVLPYSIYLTYKKGATIGKDAYGLRVVGFGDNANLKLEQVVIREVVGRSLILIPIFGGILFLINALMVVFSTQKRGIHDRIAKTQVIKIGPAWPMKKQISVLLGYVLICVVIAYLYHVLRSIFGFPR
jgi:uncharacterized RDD family membrane protein YckC